MREERKITVHHKHTNHDSLSPQKRDKKKKLNRAWVRTTQTRASAS